MGTIDVFLFPHSPKVFPDGASELANWLKADLSVAGEYLVDGMTPRSGYKRVKARSLVLFHKNKQIVGEAIAKTACQPYEGREVSPMTRRPYQGIIEFEPTSVRCYNKPLSLDVASRLTGTRLIPRGVRHLEMSQCDTLLTELAKGGFY